MESKYNHVFEPYRDCNKGKSAVVFGTGPTVNLYKHPEEDLVTVGTNGMIFHKTMELDYYFNGHCHFHSFGVCMDSLEGQNSCEWVKSMKALKAKKFSVGIVDGHQQIGHWDQVQAAGLGADLVEVNDSLGKVSRDIVKDGLMWKGQFGCAIIYPAIHFTLFTGVKRIYLVGCDSTQAKSFWHPMWDNMPQSEMCKEIWQLGQLSSACTSPHNWQSIKEHFFDRLYPEVEIIWVNPVSTKLFKILVNK